MKLPEIEEEIDFEVFRCYQCTDSLGLSLLFLTENIILYGDGVEDPQMDSIEALYFRLYDQQWVLEWDLRDFIIHNDEGPESSIWFWTNYFEPSDLDQDGIIDLVIIYGSAGINGLDDGRIKILTFHQGRKVGLRHQNSLMDFGRHTDIDAAFYDLPRAYLVFIREQMEMMSENNHAIFPAGWQEGWRQQTTYWDED